MTIRTFKQLGQAYGPNPVTLEAKLDGEVLFSGILHTIDQPLPTMPMLTPNLGWGSPLFSWTTDVSYAGVKPLKITVTGGTVLLSNTVANYIETPPFGPPPEPGDPNYIPDAPPPPTDPSIIDKSMLYGPYVDDTVPYKDPLTNVKINDVSYSDVHINSPELIGQWYWVLNDGDVFTADVIIIPGIE